MAPSRVSAAATHSSGTSDSEDDAPETVTLTQSKERARRLNEARQVAESDAKRRRKEKNRRRDENLKRRAQETRGTGVGRPDSVLGAGKQRDVANVLESSSMDEESRNLEARMERAMREAEEEQEDEHEGGESWGSFEDDVDIDGTIEDRKESDGSSLSSGEEGSDGSTSADSMSVMEEDGPVEDAHDLEPTKDPKLDYLPEHLFSEALSNAKVPSKQNTSSPKPSLNPKPERKHKPTKKRSTKDIIIGSKTIRTVAPKTTPITSAASRTLPPGKVKRFYEGHLNLKQNQRKRRSAWDRRAANVGNMRSTTLPASHFARNS